MLRFIVERSKRPITITLSVDRVRTLHRIILIVLDRRAGDVT